MALRVWLPLNGTLENKGISDVTVTNKGATVDNNGKIGKCYSFDGTDDRIYCSAVSWSYPLSISGWFYPTNIAGTQTQYFISYNTDNGGTTGHIIGIGTYSNGSNLYVWAGGSNYSTGITLSNNIWYHLTVTIDINKNYKFYLNGELKVSGTCRNTPSSKWITIGARSNSATGAAGSASYYFKGKANDVRIYDHCLSTKEVKEISQGLVLHYKLDGLSQGSGNNLVTGLTKGGQTTVVNNTIVTSGQNSDTYFKIVLSSALELNKSYTMGIDAENLPDGGYFRFPIGSQSNSSAGYINIYNGHNEAVFIANDVIVNCGTLLMMDDNTRTAWPNQCIFKNFYIYENTSVADSSGYGNDGTITGTLETNTSNRYLVSTKFPTNTCYIKLPEITYSNFGNSYTFSWWEYMTTVSGGPMPWGFSNGNRLNCYHTTNLCWNTGDGGSNTFTPTKTAASLVDNKWHYMVITGDGTATQLYIDGVNVGKATTYKALTGTQIYISGWDAGTSYKMTNNSMNDFRIYVSALSAEDILDLYHTPANIDDLGNLHGFEMVETHDRELITGEHFARLGITSYNTGTAKFNENGASYTGKVWAPNGYINSDYIEIKNTGYTYYYDVTYSNSGGGILYIGFERFDANKTATSNSSCVYIVGSTAEIDNKRITGTVNLAKDVSGNDVKYIRIRILTDWNNSTTDNSRTANIKYFSLKEVPNNDVNAHHIYENGVYESDTISDIVPSVSRQLNTGLSEFNDFIEK